MPKQKKMTATQETDSFYILKLILFILLGVIWLRIEVAGATKSVPLPIGFVLGLIFARYEKFQIDRKIEYALLLAAMFISFFLPFGLVVSL